MVQEAVQDRRRAGDVAQELAPILQRAIAGHDRRTRFVAPQDDLEQAFAGAFGQLLHAHVVDDEQVGLEVAGQDLVALAEQFVVQEVADQVENRTIQNEKAGLDRVLAERLRQITFADAGRTEE